MARPPPERSAALRILILGGSTEASGLVRALRSDTRFAPTLSLAGRTQNPVLPEIPVRVGGFGGSTGLARALVDAPFDVVVDATHPFAVNISANAVAASAAAHRPLLRLTRSAWIAQAGDRWIEAADMRDAASKLGHAPRRVFLTIGRQEQAPFVAQPQHRYVIRSVDLPDRSAMPPDAVVIQARGPFCFDDEFALLRDYRIEVVMTKNSGGAATQAKLEAARALRIPVVMTARPPVCAAAEVVEDVGEAVKWLLDHYETEAAVRGV